MTDRGKPRWLTLGWRKILLGLGVTAAGIAGVCLARGPLFSPSAQVAATPPAPDNATTPSSANTYSYSRVAVFSDGKDGITREQLGEYLIARYGEKVEHLINHRIIEDRCKARGIEVTAKEVDQKLADDLRDLNIDRGRFVKDFLKARGKTLYEWKEDHLRPALMMMKLCHDELTVSEDDVHNAFEARYGEKVECRVIEWPAEKKAEAEAAYPQLVANEDAFAAAARRQSNTDLAVTGGKLKPFGRHTLDNAEIEAQAFALQPGQVSPLIPMKETGGYVVLKCDQRIPANTSVPFDKVREELAREVHERKAQQQFPKMFEKLQKEADVQFILERKPSDETAPHGYQRDAAPGVSVDRYVATLYGGKVKVTREELGEFLIQRYGAANLELLVNRRIIENACQVNNIMVTDDEVEAEFLVDCAKYEMNEKKKAPDTSTLTGAKPAPTYLTARERFIKEMLAPNKLSVFQYKEDIVRPRLMLARLCRDRVKVTDQDMAAAYDAHYGEKVDCRMILWPHSDETTKLVLQEYGRIRDDPRVFDEKARTQASLTLARNDGRLDVPIGHHTTGNDELERAAFSLQPGEVSSVIGTPEGLVVLKCVGRIPPQTVDPAQVRDDLVKEIREKKTQAEMPICFHELQKLANPRILIDDPNKTVDLKEEVRRDLEMSRPPQ
jgi:hypothetical protein